jgi:hypothetical protein
MCSQIGYELFTLCNMHIYGELNRRQVNDSKKWVIQVMFCPLNPHLNLCWISHLNRC